MTWQSQDSISTFVKPPEESHQEMQETAAEKRHNRIAMAAYFIAEQRGFQGDMMLDDWLQAEAEEDARFVTRYWAA